MVRSRVALDSRLSASAERALAGGAVGAMIEWEVGRGAWQGEVLFTAHDSACAA